jgi:hypothetical protein
MMASKTTPDYFDYYYYKNGMIFALIRSLACSDCVCDDDFGSEC